MKILAIHLHYSNSVYLFEKKLAVLLLWADEVWISTSNSEVSIPRRLEVAGRLIKVRLFPVDNRFHDWSGFIEFFRALDVSDEAIFCNESLFTRRVLDSQMLREMCLLQDEGPFLAGELDTMLSSVRVNGKSSVAWVSSYFFKLSGFVPAVERIIADSQIELSTVLGSTRHPLVQHLEKRRSGHLSCDLSGKLSAMLMERLLTMQACEEGVRIVSIFSGSIRRKLYRVIERLHDD